MAFRETVRESAARQVTPFHEQWERDGTVPREVYKQGVLRFGVPEEYGGGASRRTGRGDGSRARDRPHFTLQTDILAPYLLHLTTEEQKARWLPAFARGELVAAVAMTEPDSDLQGIRTRAVRDGGDGLLSGSTTFISSEINADLVVVVARTHPDVPASRGMTLLGVERGMPGFERGRNLDKLGVHAQDTAELHFDEVRVPAANVLGEPGAAFRALMRYLPQGRSPSRPWRVRGACWS